MIPNDLVLNINPYKYFNARSSLTEEKLGSIIKWLTNSAPWRLTVTDFYEQYEFSLYDVDLPRDICFLKDEVFLQELKSKIEKIFSVSLSNTIDVVAHKLEKGQTIRVHNDMRNAIDRETHRLLLQLNADFKEENGGFLLIFDKDEIFEIIQPISGNIQGFEISEKSNHAVSTIHGGERLTIIYSFRELN